MSRKSRSSRYGSGQANAKWRSHVSAATKRNRRTGTHRVVSARSNTALGGGVSG